MILIHDNMMNVNFKTRQKKSWASIDIHNYKVWSDMIFNSDLQAAADIMLLYLLQVAHHCSKIVGMKKNKRHKIDASTNFLT